MTKRFNRTIKTALCLLLAAAMAFSLSGCTSIFGPDNGSEPAKPAVEHIDHITVGTTAAPEDVNILSRSGSPGLFSYTCAVNAPLFVKGEFHKIRGYFALDYAVSADAREIRIAFPTAFHWHDGEKVTIDDLIFTLEYRRDVLKDEALATFKEVRRTADNQAVIVFSGPDAYKYLRSESALEGLLPKHIWENVTAVQTADFKGPGYNTGCGPYKIASIGTDTVELELFPGNDYLGEARIDRITIKIYPDKASLVEALAAHEIDYIYDYGSPLDYTMAELFTDKEDLDPGSYYGLDADAAVFGMDLPYCQNAAFRKAVTLCIDWEAIRELCSGSTGKVPSAGLLPPSAMGYDESYPAFAADPEEAVRQLDKAGFADKNGDGLRETPDGRTFTFRIATQDLPERQELYDKIGAIIVKGLKKAGINAEYVGSAADQDVHEDPVPEQPAEETEEGEEPAPEPAPTGIGLYIGRSEGGKDIFRTAAEFVISGGNGAVGQVSDASLSSLFESVAFSISDDRYIEKIKSLQSVLAENIYGFALCWEEYFIPYRTDEFEGQSFLPDTGEANYMLFYKIKKK